MNAPNDKIVRRYDDIEEEDNHLPNWWLFILFSTIVFMFGYWFVYHTLKLLPSPPVEYANEIDALKKARNAANPMSDDALASLAKDPAIVAEGKQVFASTCASCHGPEAAGLVGPNLTDNYWLHGANPTDIAKSMTDGYPEKGMPSWGPILGAEKVRKVTAFILSIRNTNVAGGKAPQGDPVN